MSADSAFTARQNLMYGLLGLPLAFVALPLYVILPNHYAREFGVPLATLGVVLLAARLLDAFIDPWMGYWCDRLFTRSIRAVLGFGGTAAVLLATGFGMLFFPATREPHLIVLWASVWLVLTYAAYSGLSVAHQSWAAMLGGDEQQRSRIVAWREGLGLVGVVLASVTPLLAGLPATVALFTGVLAMGWLAWTQAVRPRVLPPLQRARDIWLPFRHAAFRRLLGVFVINGIASAIPATLVLFFVQDRLQAPKGMESAFLATYFVSAAVSMPVWLRIVATYGLARSWLAGILLAVAAFVGATQLGAGDSLAFFAICAMSGVALGTDLALPGALLAGVIHQTGDRNLAAGAYFGWWNFATKLNLALSAGLALPFLAAFGYSPGARDPSALLALTTAYCLLPCVLKLVAGAALYLLIIRPAHMESKKAACP